MQFLIRFIVNIAAVAVAASLLASVSIQSFASAILVTVVLGVINTVVKPILTIIAMPINLVTFGLFSIVLNGILVLVVERLVPGFIVDGFIAAILFSLVLSVVSFLLHLITPGD